MNSDELNKSRIIILQIHKMDNVVHLIPNNNEIYKKKN